MKILNLYSGIGGNRRLWGDEHEITAVESNHEIANIYATFFPNDEVIIGDALEYLIKHYHEYDFIWGSPPCPTHSQYRYNVGVGAKGYAPVIPDMTQLYGLITFLQHHYEGNWCVENVRPYYEPLIPPNGKVGRHLVWASFEVKDLNIKSDGLRSNNKVIEAERATGFDLSPFKIKNKRQILRNCTDGRVGEHILHHLLNGGCND